MPTNNILPLVNGSKDLQDLLYARHMVNDHEVSMSLIHLLVLALALTKEMIFS